MRDLFFDFYEGIVFVFFISLPVFSVRSVVKMSFSLMHMCPRPDSIGRARTRARIGYPLNAYAETVISYQTSLKAEMFRVLAVLSVN